MEKTIKIKETEDTPRVILDKLNNKFEISGRSLPEDASKFYFPILNWIEGYVKEPNPETILNINLEYFNSSSIKQLVMLLIQLEYIMKSDKTVKVVWSYDKDDELIEIKGLEIKSILDLPFELRSIESDSYPHN
jgi:hypothetical protein